jgi:hypothetical protein
MLIKKRGKQLLPKTKTLLWSERYTKAKDVDDSKTFLFTGTGQLSSNKIKKLIYDGDWKKGEKHGKGVENYYNREQFFR